jgi:hypothetical protein
MSEAVEIRTYKSIIEEEREGRRKAAAIREREHRESHRQNRELAATDDVVSRPAPAWLVEKNRAAT